MKAKEMFQKMKEKLTKPKASSLVELQQRHEKLADECMEDRDSYDLCSKEYSLLNQDVRYHEERSEEIAIKIEDSENRKKDRVNRIAGIAVGILLTIGAEKLANCILDKNAQKYIPK